jgi:hypothetical protein
MPFDDDGLDLAATQEIGDRGANDAATAYKDPHSFTRPPVIDTFGRIIPLATLGVARLIKAYPLEIKKSRRVLDFACRRENRSMLPWCRA